jgi:hypothetical protein
MCILRQQGLNLLTSRMNIDFLTGAQLHVAVSEQNYYKEQWKNDLFRTNRDELFCRITLTITHVYSFAMIDELNAMS